MTQVFSLSVLGFSGAVLAHWLLLRLVGQAAFVRNGYAVAMAVSAALLPCLWRCGIVGAALFYLSFVILWNLYTMFLINLMNSVSLRMIIEIAGSPAEALSEAELLALYSDEEAMQSRFRDLVKGGFLTRHELELTLTFKGRALARLLGTIRRIFGIELYG